MENEIINGIQSQYFHAIMRLSIAKVAFSIFKNPVKCIQILNKFNQNRRKLLGENRIKKLAKVDGKYYIDIHIPSWPSETFKRFCKTEINQFFPVKIKVNRFHIIFIAVTKKCILNCEHCFEWDTLNGKEKLSLSDIKKIIQIFQEKGTSQIQLTGGEPMLIIDDLIEILESSDKDTEFWLPTSGYNLTLKNAQRLKNAGLTGVVISLDHFIPEIHNAFRGNNKSYQWVKEAVQNAVDSKLVTALSLCATKDFVTESNLMSYAELAKKMGVSFIQIVEPKAIGHYRGKDVSLPSEKIKLLENFLWKMNYTSGFEKYPIVSYREFNQRKTGCNAHGIKSLYIDADGAIQACPFCQTKMGKVLSENLDVTIQNMKEKGCQVYNNVHL